MKARGGANMLVDYSTQTNDPIAEYSRFHASPWKMGIIALLRPAFHWQGRQSLSSAFLKSMPAGTKVIHQHGYPLKARRQWVNKWSPLQGSRILIQGTGSGWDALSWLPFRPQSVTGVDLFSFQQSWEKVRSHARSSGLAEPLFSVSGLESLPFAPGSFDLAVSDAVFEHCRDLESVLKETKRVLRPGGFVYATYGPMWFCLGGDHFSGRGGLTHGYNHIELDGEAYKQYFQEMLVADEDAQSGGRYVELDLFSKLKTSEYLDIFSRCGFKVVDLILEVEPLALEFKEKFPERFKGILHKYPGLTADDLLIKTHLVILQSSG
jgi:SAM-dependent methyltransferase